MLTGWGYRLVAVAGAASITCLAVFVANLFAVQSVFTTYTPLFWRLDPIVLSGSELWLAVILNAVVVLAVLWPLYKPRPRRVLDTVFIAQKRVVVAVFALATLGYFNYSYRLPRTTLAITGGVLFLTLPLWFVWIRRRNGRVPDRVVLIGDDAEQLEELVETVELPYVGYLCPASVERELEDRRKVFADGGLGMTRIGGLSRLDDALVEYDVDYAVLAFAETDRGEFFGALDTCYDHGVKTKVHRRFADSVLANGGGESDLVDVAIEPWDPQDYALKRIYDIGFAVGGLIMLSPVLLVIAVAIKLDSDGPIFFMQPRTTHFGGTFTFYKFRTMVKNAEEMTGVVISEEDAGGVDRRVTRVGRILRQTHLDEIPQLWSILTGQMSVVGPRPAQTEIEHDFEAENPEWVKRWFVKPGLTGLAQLEDATGLEPEKKIYYDLLYIKNQSLRYDIEITIRQIWKTVVEVHEFLRDW